MRVRGAVAGLRVPLVTGRRVQTAYGGCHQEVAELSIPADAAHVDEAEAFDGRVVPRITGAVVASGLRVGTELYQSERGSGAGKGFSQSVCALAGLGGSGGPDDGVDVVHNVLVSLCRCSQMECAAKEPEAHHVAKEEVAVHTLAFFAKMCILAVVCNTIVR